MPKRIGDRKRDNDREQILWQKRQRGAEKSRLKSNFAHRCKLYRAAEVAEQKPCAAQQDRKDPPYGSGAETRRDAAKDHQDQKAVKKAAGRPDQALKTTLKARKNGKAHNAQKQVERNRGKPEFPAHQKAAKGNNEGLQRHGNAQKGKGNGDQR